jgi:acetyl-CoA synthetase
MWYIFGRSDDTIKIAGKRLGPAEVESVLVGHPDVLEAAAVGVPDAIKGNRLVCFVVLVEGVTPQPSLSNELRDVLIAELGKPLAPKAIHFIDDIPKTRNAKVMRRILRAAYLGEDPGDTSSLVNPESLDSVEGLDALGKE